LTFASVESKQVKALLARDNQDVRLGHVTDVASSISSSVHSSPSDKLIDFRTQTVKMVEHGGTERQFLQ